MTYLRRKALFLALAVLCSLPILGRMCQASEMLKSMMHTEAEYHIRVFKAHPTPEALQALERNPKETRIVVWQLAPGETQPGDVALLLRWVEQGGVLWFYDCRLASLFGFTPRPLKAKELPRTEEYKGEYGAVRKAPGVNTFGVAPSEDTHPVLQGVGSVQVFLIDVGDKTYSAVEIQNQQVPLLKVDLTSTGELHKVCLAALRHQGKGSIVFKPLVWDEVLSGQRFQGNLLEWSAGYTIPSMTGGPRQERPIAVSNSTMPPRDHVVLASGAQLPCTVVNTHMSLLEPGRPERRLEVAKARQLLFRYDGVRDRVTLRDGSILYGVLSFEQGLVLRSARGEEKTYETSRVLQLEIGRFEDNP